VHPVVDQQPLRSTVAVGVDLLGPPERCRGPGEARVDRPADAPVIDEPLVTVGVPSWLDPHEDEDSDEDKVMAR